MVSSRKYRKADEEHEGKLQIGREDLVYWSGHGASAIPVELHPEALFLGLRLQEPPRGVLDSRARLPG